MTRLSIHRLRFARPWPARSVRMASSTCSSLRFVKGISKSSAAEGLPATVMTNIYIYNGKENHLSPKWMI